MLTLWDRCPCCSIGFGTGSESTSGTSTSPCRQSYRDRRHRGTSGRVGRPDHPHSGQNSWRAWRNPADLVAAMVICRTATLLVPRLPAWPQSRRVPRVSRRTPDGKEGRTGGLSGSDSTAGVRLSAPAGEVHPRPAVPADGASPASACRPRPQPAVPPAAPPPSTRPGHQLIDTCGPFRGHHDAKGPATWIIRERRGQATPRSDANEIARRGNRPTG